MHRVPTRWATLAVLLLLPRPSLAIPPDPGRDSVHSSLVQVFVQANPRDPFSPWQGKGVTPYFGSGVIIEGRRVLTVAHVVDGAVTIEVKRQDQTKKYTASVDVLAHECDLAILSVDEAGFFDGSEPLPLGQTPRIEEAVRVYGFPEGGDSASATSGIVSRVEVGTYSHSWRDLLLVQVDAAINPGNSGGPVVAEGRLAGVAMQMLSGAENIGYMVPASVVRHLLDDLKDGRNDGFPSLGIQAQGMENPALRAAHGMGEEDTGALVTAVSSGGTADGILEVGDVLLSVDGKDIAEDLTAAAQEGFRIHFSHLLQSRQVGETVTLGVLRDGRRLQRRAVLKNEPLLVPGSYVAGGSGYYIVGGLVFVPLTLDYLYLSSYGSEDYVASDLDYYAYFHNWRTADRDQVIVMSKVLPSPVNRGYHDMVDYVVASVQGKRPRNMKDLIRIVEGKPERQLKVVMETGEVVVLDMERARREGEKILKMHNVSSDRSEDLR